MFFLKHGVYSSTHRKYIIKMSGDVPAGY